MGEWISLLLFFYGVDYWRETRKVFLTEAQTSDGNSPIFIVSVEQWDVIGWLRMLQNTMISDMNRQ